MTVPSPVAADSARSSAAAAASESAAEDVTRAGTAVGIATRAARRLGLRAESPAVLHDTFSVLVHLAPEPVVVRVPSLLLEGAEEQAARQRCELAVAGWLADRGAPVVRPSPLVPREPHCAEGRSLTFWEFVEEQEPLRETAQGDPAKLEARFVEQSGWAARLHDLLAECPVELPLLAPVVPGIGRMLAELRRHPGLVPTGDLERAEREYAVVEALVGDLPRYFPQARIQPLHGDSPAYNLLRTADGPRFADFEDTTLGPVEWDLTLSGEACVAEYERAGGVPVDRVLLRLLERARRLQVFGAMAAVPQMPELGPMLGPVLDEWRAAAPLTPADLPH